MPKREKEPAAKITVGMQKWSAPKIGPTIVHQFEHVVARLPNRMASGDLSLALLYDNRLGIAADQIVSVPTLDLNDQETLSGTD